MDLVNDEHKTEAINPSSYAKSQGCPFEFYVKKELKLTSNRPTNNKMLMGTLLHTAMAAYDIGKWGRQMPDLALVKPDDITTFWKEAVDLEIEKYRAGPTYHADQTNMLESLRNEVVPFMTGMEYATWDNGKMRQPIMKPLGGYIHWRTHTQQEYGWKLIAIEKRFVAKLEKGIYIAPRPDGVIREAGKLKVIERKSTQTAFSVDFKQKFRTNLQTTMEVMAVERFYDEPVEQVLVLPIYYTRSKSKFWEYKDIPQPIFRIEYDIPWPIEKDTMVKGALEGHLVNWAKHMLPFRRQMGIWEQNTSLCGTAENGCDLYDVCWTRGYNLSDLEPAEPSEWSETLLRELEKHNG